MKTSELKEGQKRVEIEATVTEIGERRTVKAKFTDDTYEVAIAILKDETGTVKLSLWNEQIDKINVGNKVKISNGYVTGFKGETQLNVGKFGTLTVV